MFRDKFLLRTLNIYLIGKMILKYIQIYVYIPEIQQTDTL